VIHNAIDGDLFSRGDRAAARVRLGLRGDFPLVVSVGRLVSGKRHHVLIEAFAQLRRNVPETELVIVGAPSFEPQYPARLRRQVQLLGLEGAVRFTGDVPQAQVVDWLRAANVFALLSAREGCCNAVLEALAVGIPVVATAAGDNAKFVRSDVNGAIVPFDDVSAAMRSLAAVVSRRDWNAEGISAALSAQVGSWRVVAGRVVEFFHEMLAQRSALHASARA
jgi:glycosyltransferase involved in cell wall biosynthesis